MLVLEDGQVAYGDCAAVQYSGAGGRDPLFLAKDFIPVINEHVAPTLVGKEITSFREMCAAMEAIEVDGQRLHTAIRYGVSQAILDAAHNHGVSATAFLAAALLQALMAVQKKHVPLRRMRKPLKVQIPVNLRRLFPSTTLRNFALYVNPEIDPRLGDFTFDELCKRVHHHMGMEVIPQHMRARIAANVGSERLWIVKILPLFLKNIALRIAFNTVGETKVCLSMSNLGAVEIPAEMKPYISRFDFILGAPSLTPVNCGILSYNGTLYVNFTRSIQESELELAFWQVLQQQGLEATVESNGSSHP